MRTLAEVCLLDKTTGWPADVLVLFRQLSLHTLDDFCGNPGTEAYYLLCNAAPAWYAGPRSPLASPVVHELMSPVLRDAVGLLVPLLLPECHKPSPPEETVRKLRKLLPVQIAILAASGALSGRALPWFACTRASTHVCNTHVWRCDKLFDRCATVPCCLPIHDSASCCCWCSRP